MMDTKMKPITAIYPRTLNTSQHMVLHTPYDPIQVAIDKLKRDYTVWVRPEDVQAVLEGLGRDQS